MAVTRLDEIWAISSSRQENSNRSYFCQFSELVTSSKVIDKLWSVFAFKNISFRCGPDMSISSPCSSAQLLVIANKTAFSNINVQWLTCEDVSTWLSNVVSVLLLTLTSPSLFVESSAGGAKGHTSWRQRWSRRWTEKAVKRTFNIRVKGRLKGLHWEKRP